MNSCVHPKGPAMYNDDAYSTKPRGNAPSIALAGQRDNWLVIHFVLPSSGHASRAKRTGNRLRGTAFSIKAKGSDPASGIRSFPSIRRTAPHRASVP